MKRGISESPGWTIRELRDLCRTITDGTHLPPPFTDTGIPFLFVRNIVAGSIDFDVEKHISEQTFNELTKKHRAERGDVLFSAVGSFGFAAVVRTDAKFAFQRHIAHIKPDATLLDADFLAFFLNSPPGRSQSEAVAMGGGQRTVTLADLRRFRIPVAPLSEQHRMAADLTKSLAMADAARRVARERLAAAESLPAAYLREVFNGPGGSKLPAVPLGDVCDLLPSKSIATTGDVEVRAITTACLSEGGFLATGVKTARMRAEDVPDCLVKPGEVLVARSNTPELVGRAAMYRGEPKGIVASDLTIRIWPRCELTRSYVAAFLSYLYLTGYWRERAGGASGTMKKITREQLLAQELRIPSEAFVARDIAADLSQRLEAASSLIARCREELAAVEALPAALLRATFNGDA